ncbi:MAG: DUF6194 family protein [Pirellulales bacterium]
MDQAEVKTFILENFSDVRCDESAGDSFFFVGDERMMPFATLVTSDKHDQVSDLNRPDVYRLNIGIGKTAFGQLFGDDLLRSLKMNVAPPGYDYTTLDHVMPHPVYGYLGWVCVLNPGYTTWESARKLLQVAHNSAST